MEKIPLDPKKGCVFPKTNHSNWNLRRVIVCYRRYLSDRDTVWVFNWFWRLLLFMAVFLFSFVISFSLWLRWIRAQKSYRINQLESYLLQPLYCLAKHAKRNVINTKSKTLSSYFRANKRTEEKSRIFFWMFFSPLRELAMMQWFVKFVMCRWKWRKCKTGNCKRMKRKSEHMHAERTREVI